MFASAQALGSHNRSKKHQAKVAVRPAVRLEFALLPWYMQPSSVANVVSRFEASRPSSATGEAKALISDPRGEGPQEATGEAKALKKRKAKDFTSDRPTHTKHRGPGFAAAMIRLVQEKKKAGEKRISAPKCTRNLNARMMIQQ